MSDNIPSPEHLAFAESVKNIIGPTVEQFGFRFHRQEIKSWMTTLIYRKEKLYVKIYASTHWRDNPSSYNIILGEGDSEDFFEWDWNSIPLWRLKLEMGSTTEVKEYPFPKEDNIAAGLISAKDELLKYGQNFLSGDLVHFYEARKNQNKNRSPYQIYKMENGKCLGTDEPKSLEQKKRYS